MVSIPDWSRFSRLQFMQGSGKAKHSPDSMMTKYYKQQEAEAIRQAEEQGYFLVPTEDYLVQNCDQYSDVTRCKDVDDLYIVKLSSIHLRKIGDLAFCVNLQICVLNNNFLTRFDGLAACRQLVKLDLHSNQIANVPGLGFWSGMKHLRALYLHDNPLGKFETLHSLSACRSLAILTMFDTPMCLKKNYRHHVVNTIWSLKALDSFVVSDEEIIEDAVFGGKFRALNPGFRIELCPYIPQKVSCQEEMTSLERIISRIDTVQSKYSPVLIIQRYIRGFLVRKHLGIWHRPQRSCLRGSAAPTVAAGATLPVIPTDSEASTEPRAEMECDKTVIRSSEKSKSTPSMSTSKVDGDATARSDNLNIDFDTYLQMSREASSLHDTDVIGSTLTSLLGHEGSNERDTTSFGRSQDSALVTEYITKTKKNLHIDLSKLEHDPRQSMVGDETASLDTAIRESLPDRYTLDSDGRRSKPRRKFKKDENEKKLRRLGKSMKQFFGPVIQPCSSPRSIQEEINADAERLSKTVSFRLQGFKPRIMFIDPTEEMLISKREAGREIRAAEAMHQNDRLNDPSPRLVEHKHTSLEERVFNRVFKTMGLSCLSAIQKAYWDRDKAEKTSDKIMQYLNVREEREHARERVRMYREQKLHQLLANKHRDRMRMIEALGKVEMNKMSKLERTQDQRAKLSSFINAQKADKTFVSEFCTQNSSISQALIRFDHTAKMEAVVRVTKNVVTKLKATSGDQHDTVIKYMEHRRLMRQTESAMSRAALDTRLLREANEEMIIAQARVAHLKAKRDIARAYIPLPRVCATDVHRQRSMPPSLPYEATSGQRSSVNDTTTGPITDTHTDSGAAVVRASTMDVKIEKSLSRQTVLVN